MLEFNFKNTIVIIVMMVIIYLVGLAAYNMITSDVNMKKSSYIEKDIYKDFNVSEM